jgi:hypothetical protein
LYMLWCKLVSVFLLLFFEAWLPSSCSLSPICINIIFLFLMKNVLWTS